MIPERPHAGAILIVEDDPGTAELERRALRRAGRSLRLAGSVAEALEALREDTGYDAILADYRLPDGEPWPIFEAARQAVPAIPVILVTAAGDERLAAEVLRRGGTDYLIKTEGFWEQLPAAVERALRLSRVERHNARLVALVESADEVIVNQSLSGEVLSWNKGAERVFGYSAARAVGRPMSMLVPADRREEEAAVMERARAGEATLRLETERVGQDGERVDVSITVSPVFGARGEVTAAAVLMRDIRERKRAERHLAIRNEVTRITAEAESFAEVAPAVLAAVGDGLGWPLAALWLLDEDGGTVRCAAAWHREGGPLERLAAVARETARPPGSFPAELWAGRGAVGVATVAAAHPPELRQAAVAAGLDVAVTVPVCAGGRVSGVLEILVRGLGPLDEQLAGVLAAVGSQVGQFLEKSRAEEALRDSAAFDRALFEGSPLPMWVYDIDSLAILAVNDAAVRQYGYSRDELLAMTLKDLRSPDDVPALVAAHQDEVPEYRRAGVFRHRRKDGSVVRVEVHVHDVRIGGRLLRLALLQDVTDRQRLEDQLRQAQKMEAVGQLAGGVAHDFNNLLTIVNGYADLLLARSRPDEEGHEELSEIRRAGERAAALTRQLLAFSRKREADARLLDLNAVVGDMDRMLRRLIGEDIELVTALAPTLGSVRADPSHLEQVIMNLAVNARDAMGDGGTLTIETAGVELDEAFLRSHLEVRPGPYVLLAVSDTGHGMEPAILQRIFEPFFTTKEPGHGTGLGLATVFGIVQQSGGDIYVYSEPGRGTTFKIYLPVAGSPAPATASGPGAGERPVSGETLLVVEDEEQVRRLACRILGDAGYRVLEAADPEAALALAGDPLQPIDLLLTDVVMPRLSGPVLAEHLARLRPGLRMLFVSGYTGRAMTQRGQLAPGAPFLEKPFTPQALLAKVREVLDAVPA